MIEEKVGNKMLVYKLMIRWVFHILVSNYRYTWLGEVCDARPKRHASEAARVDQISKRAERSFVRLAYHPRIRIVPSFFCEYLPDLTSKNLFLTHSVKNSFTQFPENAALLFPTVSISLLTGPHSHLTIFPTRAAS